MNDPATSIAVFTTVVLALAGLPYAYRVFRAWRDRQPCQLVLTDSVGPGKLTTTYSGPASGMVKAVLLHRTAVDEIKRRVAEDHTVTPTEPTQSPPPSPNPTRPSKTKAWS